MARSREGECVAIAAALAVRGAADMAAADDFTGRLPELWSLHDPVPGVTAFIAPYLADDAMIRAIDRRGSYHAFDKTVAISLFGWASTSRDWGGGTSALRMPSLPWLKAVDRTMHYCLTSVGRRTGHIEGAGAVAHFQSERVVSMALYEPHTDGAVDALLVHFEKMEA